MGTHRCQYLIFFEGSSMIPLYFTTSITTINGPFEVKYFLEDAIPFLGVCFHVKCG